MSLAYAVPLVRFGNTLINLNRVDYAMTKKESGTDNRGYPKTRYKFYIYFNTPNKHLVWSYDTEAEAKDAMDRFEKLNETFLMAELP